LELTVHNELCSGCRACLLACSLVNYRSMTPALAALRIEALFPSPGTYRVHVCDQCGACAEACPEEAIRLEDGAYLINQDLCTACGICREECPYGVILWERAADRPIKCTGCGECAAICPRDAIEASVRAAGGAA
jgi:Fe-S-cluster-containing hydrogenase component 2